MVGSVSPATFIGTLEIFSLTLGQVHVRLAVYILQTPLMPNPAQFFSLSTIQSQRIAYEQNLTREELATCSSKDT